MKEDVIQTVTNRARNDIKSIINEKSKKESVSYSINARNGEIKFLFKDIGKSSKLNPRRDEERYNFELFATLEDSSDLKSVKEEFYEILDEILPNLEHSVKQDYSSSTVKYTSNLTQKEVKQNLM